MVAPTAARSNTTSPGDDHRLDTVDVVNDADVADVSDPAPTSEPEIDRSKRSFLVRHGLSGWDLVGAIVCLLLIVLFAPPLMFEGWTVRAVLLLVVGPIGVVLLVARARTRDLAAIVLLSALAWTLLVAAWSPSPRSALLGSAGRDLSAWTVIASASCWSIGRQLSRRGRDVLVDVFVWATAFAALVGILQVVADVRTGPLALGSGRPTSFLSNPVYFGAVCAAGLVAAVARWTASSWRVSAPAVLLLGLGVSLSGSRVALAAAVLSLVGLAGAHRSRERLIAVAAGFGALVAGVALDRAVGAGRNAADRLTEGTGGGRVTVWGYGLESLWDRPLRGYGFGMFRPAVQGRFSAEFVRDHAVDEASSPWFDAHNVVIGLLVAVGVVGAVLFVAWVAVWAVRTSGPLAWALVPIVLHWCLQPVSIYTLPLAMLVFGAAGPRDEPEASVGRRAVAVTAVVGALLGSALMFGDVAFRLAADDRDSGRAEFAGSFFLNDPIVDDLIAQLHALDPDVPDRQAAQLEWRRQVTRDEPDRPFWWSLLARQQIDAEQYEAADESIRRALDLQFHNVRAWRAEAVLAVRIEDADRLQVALDRLCELGQPECDLTTDELLAPPAADPADG